MSRQFPLLFFQSWISWLVAGTLHHQECRNEDGRGKQIDSPLLTVYEQRGKDKVMNDEDDEIDGHHQPQRPYILPKQDPMSSGSNGTEIETDDGCEEKDDPQPHIDQFLPRDMIFQNFQPCDCSHQLLNVSDYKDKNNP